MNEKQILWKCRRGMLEMDLIFLKFFQEQYPFLSTLEQETFVRLLDESDPQLAAWILGAETCTSSDLNNIIKKIKINLTLKIQSGDNYVEEFIR